MAGKMTAEESRKAFLKNLKNLKKLSQRPSLFGDRPWVLGIDPSLTGTAVVAVNIRSSKIIFNSFLCKKCYKRTTRSSDTVYQRLHLIQCYLRNIIKFFPSCMIFMEGYSYNKRNNREIMGEVSHAIRQVLWDNPQHAGPTITVAPTQLKKYITGQGKGVPKDKIILNVYKMFGIEVQDNDEADATVLAAIGHDILVRLVNVVDGIPTSDNDLAGYLKILGKKLEMPQTRWEVIQSIITNKCGDTLYDFFNIEDWKHDNQATQSEGIFKSKKKSKT